MVTSEKPDLVLLDIMMPMMSGYEVCEQIKANPETQGIPSSAYLRRIPRTRALSLRVGAQRWS